MSERLRLRERIKRLGARFAVWRKTDMARSAVLLIGAYVLLCLILFILSAPERYSLTVGSISRQTINANKDVVDETATQERRKNAAASVEPSYHFQDGVNDEVQMSLQAVFDELRTVQQYGLTLRTGEETAEYLRSRTFTDEEIEYALKLVTTLNLSRYQATTLLRTTTEDFDTMVSTVSTAVSNQMNSGIREGKVTDAISTIQQIVGYRVDISLVQNLLPTVLRTCLSPNWVVDQAATERAREEAMAAVEPIVYQQGQNIIREGEVVQQNQLDMLKSLGLLQDDQYDFSVYGGIALLVLFAVVLYVMTQYMLHPRTLGEPRSILVVVCVMVLHVTICAITLKLSTIYFVPAVMASMLLTVLMGARCALSVTACLSVLLCGLAAGDTSVSLLEMISVSLITLISGTVCVRFLRHKQNRLRLLLSGAVAGAVNGAVIVALGWMTSMNSSAFWFNALWAMGAGVLSGLLATALQPLFESVFSLATASKLLELGNPNHPLLRRLQIEASGTYHHSIIVANLAEAAAKQIGADALLARTGAYFHDVGKLKRPQYFKENQVSGENPLNALDPYVAAAIVTAHTKDGVILAQKYRLPPEIRAMIEQHHGDTPVMYFYRKAVEQAEGKEVDIADFRYRGTRPSTREAAILMLADTVEAAVRAMQDPTPEKIRERINQLVRSKLDDGQLSDSPLSLRDIEGVCEAFAQQLRGVYHERIEYPTGYVPHRGAFNIDEAEQKNQEPEPQPERRRIRKKRKGEEAQ